MKDFYSSVFNTVRERFEGKLPASLMRLRDESMDHFMQVGFPTTKDEQWRSTNLKSLHGQKFPLARSEDPKHLTPDQFLTACVAGVNAFRSVLVNGQPSPTHSSQEDLPEGCLFTTLSEAMKLHPELLESHFGSCWKQEVNTLTSLNTALHQDGSFLYVPEGVKLENPFHFLNISLRNGKPMMAFPRNLVIAEKGSKATILETYVGFGLGEYFTNAVTEIVAKEGSTVDHYKFQNELTEATHIGSLLTHQAEKSLISSHSLSLGGGLVRNDIKMRMMGENAQCILNGLFVLTGQQHVDHHTTVDHAVPHCSSQEIYKGVLDEQSHGVFDGQVLVRQNAQKSDAQQMNQNLLLSEDAIIDTTPRLEIYADDVKCTHGATVGALSEEAIFYLRSRGLNRSEARNLLTFAFANEMVKRVKVEKLRTYLECYLLTHFADGHLRSKKA